MNTLRKTVMLGMSVLTVLAVQVCSAVPAGAVSADASAQAGRSIAPYFTPATSRPKAPDADGFIQPDNPQSQA